MKMHLPSGIPKYPQRTSQRLDWLGSWLALDGAIGDECDLVGKERDVELLDGDLGRRFVLQFVEDLRLGENAAGTSEFSKLFGEQGGHGCRICPH